MSTSYPSLGKYQIIEEIGRGGMGAVYKAYDPFLDRTVAIKVLAPHLVWEKDFIERFMREARAAAQLQHSHIIPVHDVGQEGNNYYFVMAYLPGQSLKQRIAQKGRLEPAEALLILQQLAAALDYAHSKNLVHRDVKPGNVMFNELGEVVLTDFGIVKAAQEVKLTATGAAMGTAEYMAPEQVEGKPVDARTDQYALGIIAFEMLTGRVPFEGETVTAVLHKQVYEPPPSILAFCPDLPRAVEGVMNRALSKPPDKRYASCGEFVKALEPALAPAVAKPRKPVDKPKPKPKPTLPPAPAGPVESPAPKPTVHLEPKRELAPKPVVAPAREARKIPWPLMGAGLAVLVIVALVIVAISGKTGPAAPTPMAAIRQTATSAPASATPAPTGTLQQTSTPTNTPRPPTQTPTASPTLRASTPVPQPANVISLNNTNRLAVLAEWSGAGHRIVFSPDSKLLATGGMELSLWDVSSGREVRLFIGPTGTLYSLAFSPDGKILASRDDNTVRLWDVLSGHELRTIFVAGGGWDVPVIFSPDGSLVATRSLNRILLYEVASGRELRTPSEFSAGAVYGLAFSPDGKMLASAGDGGVKLWEVSSGRQVRTLDTDPVENMALSPDGKLLATGWKLWEVASGRELHRAVFRVPGKRWGVAFSPDGKLLAVGSEDKILILWDVTSGSVLGTLPLASPVVSVTFSPDGKLLASGAADGTVQVWGIR